MDKIYFYRAMYTSPGVQIFTECSRCDNKHTVKFSDFSYANTRSNNLSKLKSYLKRFNSIETSLVLVSLKSFLKHPLIKRVHW